MKSNVKFNPFLRIIVFVSSLVLLAIATAIALFYYVFGIPDPEGMSLASWPYTFTENFSLWMRNEDGNLAIEDRAIERLDKYGLWLQVFDESGEEIFSYHKPEHYPTHYSASDLIALSTSTYEHGNTLFVNHFEDQGASWNYIIGFPYAIGKSMLYYNGENVGRLSPVFRLGIGVALGLLLIFVLAYGFWITKHLGKISKGIGNILLRNYTPLPQKGIFSAIYGELDKMNREILQSDKTQQDTERVRLEWIANITHDLKTPLSPVKGYAELLSDSTTLDGNTVQEYGKIILNNVNHTEKLINDLKLTYQLDSGAFPYHPQIVRVIRYVREVVIDIVNDPAFSERNVEFESSTEEISVQLDADLFRRALGNIIINALTHNPPETKVTVKVDTDKQEGIRIMISDNGIGMSDTEQSNLFNRYYRGTNTKEKTEGSGLGLSIAKQIVMLHGGQIMVESKRNEGTRFVILIPSKQGVN